MRAAIVQSIRLYLQSYGPGFESQNKQSTLFHCQILYILLRKDESKTKRGRVWTTFKKLKCLIFTCAREENFQFKFMLQLILSNHIDSKFWRSVNLDSKFCLLVNSIIIKTEEVADSGSTKSFFSL